MQTTKNEASAIQCEWIPGTMNQVRVRLLDGDMELSIDQLQKAAGKDAVHEMYLKGLISLPFSSKLKEALAARR
jgi:hypothetical protein